MFGFIIAALLVEFSLYLAHYLLAEFALYLAHYPFLWLLPPAFIY